MQQKLFTQEGKEYIIRTANTIFFPTIGSPQTVNKMVYINVLDPTNSIDPFYLAFQTTKPIIPLAYSLSASDNNANSIVVDVSNCYFSITSGNYPNRTVVPRGYVSLGKIFPYVERVYYTDNNNNNFISRYNQIVFSDNDFIPTTDPLALQANSSLAGAFTNLLSTGDKPVLPASTLTVNISLTYLELQ